MKISANKLWSTIYLEDVIFSERFLKIDNCSNGEDNVSKICDQNQCFQAKIAFEQGLLKDFEIKGVRLESDMKLKKIKECVSFGYYMFETDDAKFGTMEITLIYKVSDKRKTFFVACKNTILFPSLMLENSDDELFLSPYIKCIEVYAFDNLEELMEYYPCKEDIVVSLTDVDILLQMFEDIELFMSSLEDQVYSEKLAI